jgi:hypothetical protein
MTGVANDGLLRASPLLLKGNKLVSTATPRVLAAVSSLPYPRPSPQCEHLVLSARGNRLATATALSPLCTSQATASAESNTGWVGGRSRT